MCRDLELCDQFDGGEIGEMVEGDRGEDGEIVVFDHFDRF